jgi:hypothetical protein
MLAQVGQFYSDEVDQYYSGANILVLNHDARVLNRRNV